jgi:hypothetical protein
MNTIRLLIRELLKEDAYKERIGHRFVDDINLVKNSVNKDGYFLHFSDVPKIGINPKSSYLSGVYFYPNIEPLYKRFFADVGGPWRGQGRAARYVYLVKLKPSVKLIEGEEITKKAKKIISEITEPFLSSSLDISDYLNYPKKLHEPNQFYAIMRTSSTLIRAKYPSIDEIKNSGLLDVSEKNARDLFELYKILAKRPKMPEAKKLEFSNNFNQMLVKYFNRFTEIDFNRLSYNKNFTLDNTLSTKNVRGVLDRIVRFMSPYEIDSTGNNIILNESKLKKLHDEESSFGPWEPSIMGAEIDFKLNVLSAAIKLRATTSEIYSYIMNMRNNDIPEMISEFIRWLYSSDNKNYDLIQNNGKTLPLSSITNQCIDKLKNILGENYTKFLKVVRKDEVGMMIMLVMGPDIDGINDTGSFELGSKYDYKIAFGEGGRLGQYEGRQLFLKAPIENKIEIITMIDRFEGVPDTEKIPGSHTPDTENSYSTNEDPRYYALKKRLRRNVEDEKQMKKEIPRERWS